MSKTQETLDALQKSRIFFGNLAASIAVKYGKDSASRFFVTCDTLDESIRALRDSEIVAASIPKSEPLDLSEIKTVSILIQ